MMFEAAVYVTYGKDFGPEVADRVRIACSYIVPAITRIPIALYLGDHTRISAFQGDSVLIQVEFDTKVPLAMLTAQASDINQSLHEVFDDLSPALSFNVRVKRAFSGWAADVVIDKISSPNAHTMSLAQAIAQAKYWVSGEAEA